MNLPDEEKVKKLLREQVVDLIDNGWLRGFKIDTNYDYEDFHGEKILRQTVTAATLEARDKDGARVEVNWTRTVGR